MASAGATARLRVAHLSPDTPAIDVAIAPLPEADPLTDPGADLASGLTYGDVGGFAEFPPGRYAVSIRRAGSGPSTPPALSEAIVVPPGGAVTVALTGLFADAALRTLPEDLSAPPPGTARIRVLAAAAAVAPLDLSHGSGAVLASGLSFGEVGNAVAVPAGAAVLHADGGSGQVDVPADFASGSLATVLALDRPGGGLELRVVLDAAAPAVVPAGGVEAGGGTPAAWAGWPAAWAGWPAAVLALASAAVRFRRRLVVLSAGLVSMSVVGAGLVPAPVAAAPVAEIPVAAADVGLPVVVAGADTAQPVPTRVRVPGVGIDAPLEGVGLDAAGALVVPADGSRAGWYAQGRAPGAVGPAVLTGHVDGGGAPAVFARLGELRPGDPVLVGRTDGTTLRFAVTRVTRSPKAAFPTEAVYGPTTGPELRLITCGGAFDRSAGSYVDNVVVWAAPA